MLALAAESKLALDALLARHPIEFNHVVGGKMQLYHDASALAATSRMSALKRQQRRAASALGA